MFREDVLGKMEEVNVCGYIFTLHLPSYLIHLPSYGKLIRSTLQGFTLVKSVILLM
jgi:hypothetical protein